MRQFRNEQLFLWAWRRMVALLTIVVAMQRILYQSVLFPQLSCQHCSPLIIPTSLAGILCSIFNPSALTTGLFVPLLLQVALLCSTTKHMYFSKASVNHKQYAIFSLFIHLNSTNKL
jgi:hypothetical protein